MAGTINNNILVVVHPVLVDGFIVSYDTVEYITKEEEDKLIEERYNFTRLSNITNSYEKN